MSYGEYRRYQMKLRYMVMYHYYLESLVTKMLDKLPANIQALPPISWIHDFDKTDIFARKAYTHFYAFCILMLFVLNSMLQVFRRTFCRRKIIVKKKKSVNKDSK